MADPNPVTPPDLLTLQTLYLCGVAYMADPALMPGIIEKNQVPPSGGRWKCLWGPLQNDDDANLAFVAGFFPDPNAAAESIFVTIRGTDVDVGDISGILEQIWEDLDADDPQPMPWALNDPARIASGTLDGLAIIQGLADFTQPPDQETLAQFLTTFFANPENANVKTVVAGHSLGGCLASIVAMWIRVLLPNYRGTIQPITFAGPTAGNNGFAKYYDELFPSARRFQNTLDVIPLAFYDLDAVNSIYAANGLDTPTLIQDAIDVMKAGVDGLSYVQPSRGAQLLTGAFFKDDNDDWEAQAFHQHHLATYLGLLTNTPVDVAALPRPRATRNIKSRLFKRVGPVDTET